MQRIVDVKEVQSMTLELDEVHYVRRDATKKDPRRGYIRDRLEGRELDAFLANFARRMHYEVMLWHVYGVSDREEAPPEMFRGYQIGNVTLNVVVIEMEPTGEAQVTPSTMMTARLVS